MRLLLALWLAGAQPSESAASAPPVGAAGCVGCRAHVDDVVGRYSESEWKALRAGEILIQEEQRDPGTTTLAGRTRAAGLIPHPPERVWAVLVDFEAWPRFIPLITRTEIVRRQKQRAWVRQHYRVLFLGLSHTTIYEFAPAEGRLTWSLDREAEHDIAASEGWWQLVPLSGGTETLICYSAAMDAGRAVPEFVEDLLARRSLRRLIAALRGEVERRYGTEEAKD